MATSRRAKGLPQVNIPAATGEQQMKIESVLKTKPSAQSLECQRCCRYLYKEIH
jgi:hypothetical protein